MLDPDDIDGVQWWRGDAAHLPLPDESVAAIVTSCPYNVGIQYPNYSDNLPWSAYWAKARQWSKEMARVLQPGGRLWLVISPTVPKTPGEPGGERVPFAARWTQMLTDRELAWRDMIVWRQQPDGACAWGSYRLPTAPNVRGRCEVVLSLYKPPYERPYPSQAFRGTVNREGWRDADWWAKDGKPLPTGKDKPKFDPELHEVELGGPWTDLVTNVWDIKQTTGAGRYPGSFPVELAARCVRLSTWPNELVVDPFAGGGATGEACKGLRQARRCLLVDLP